MSSHEKGKWSTAIRTHPPSRGFSKGTLHGSIVSSILLFVLLLLVCIGNPTQESPQANYADIVSGILLGIVGVWVVGGVVEIEGKYADVTLKAAGGIAIIIFTSLIVRPFYNSERPGKNDIDLILLPGETIGKIVEAAKDSYRKRGVPMTFRGYDADIAKIRPDKNGEIQYYVRPWVFEDGWKKIFALINSDLPCLTITPSSDGYEFILDRRASSSVGDKIVCNSYSNE